MSKVILVTGASRGIGKGIADLLKEKNHTVISVGTKESDIDNYIQGDISADCDRKRIIDTIYEKYGRLDVLVNNAGVAPLVRSDLLDMTEESMDRLLGINLKGTFFLTQYAAKKMIAENAGTVSADTVKMIVNITSISAETSSMNRGEYCISKAGLSMVTKLFAERLSSHNINVYEIRPGIIETDMTKPVKEKYTAMIENGLLPIKRMGQPSDVAAAVNALVDGGFLYSTGEIFNVDGGFHISRL
jgi:NAD(P)-dependent dehydrogenase (short-subunit alcohol dehydrogenase family)